MADLVPVFMPQLAVMLLHLEDQKGSPLNEAEVLGIRDRAACIMMERADAEVLWQQRGRDVDPENAWYDFQMLRRHLGRKPDIDVGARVQNFANDDPAMLEAEQRARSTLDDFVALLRTTQLPSMIKTLVVHGERRLFLWLGDVRIVEGGFDAVVVEVPQQFPGLRQGQRRVVPRDAVVDWMINERGMIHGGFSLRAHRERLPPEQRAAFDAQVGARGWA